MTNIIVAVLGLIGTLTGAYLANRKSSALIAYRLEQLERKQDAHNSLMERTYKLEEQSALYEERLRSVDHRIDNLERSQLIDRERS